MTEAARPRATGASLAMEVIELVPEAQDVRRSRVASRAGEPAYRLEQAMRAEADSFGRFGR